MERTAEDVDRLIAFGAELCRLRKERGCTKQQLADLTGITPTYLTKLERGEQSATLLVLCGLAVALQLSLVDLLRTTSDRLGHE